MQIFFRTYVLIGKVICTATYHESDPSSRLCTESVYDEAGREIEAMDARGEVNGVLLSHKKTYHTGTDALRSVTAPNGAKLCYGYHHLTDDLISMTGDDNGVEHSNRMQQYTAGYLTKLDNPAGMCYNYTYDGYDYSVTYDHQRHD